MESSINYISYSPNFFLRLNKGTAVLGHHGLPKKLHLTIAGSNNSNDVNFHVTNENGAKLKPRITVAIADKTLLKHKMATSGLIWLYQQLEPIHLRKRPKRKRLGYRDRALYIRLDNLYENPSFVDAYQDLVYRFWQNVKLQGKARIKIQPGIVSSLNDWAISSKSEEFFWQNIRPAFKNSFNAVESGYWFSQEYTGMVFVIEGCLYKLKEDITLKDILSVWTDGETFEALKSNYEFAIKTVSAADDYEDTKAFDLPVRLL